MQDAFGGFVVPGLLLCCLRLSCCLSLPFNAAHTTNARGGWRGAVIPCRTTGGAIRNGRVQVSACILLGRICTLRMYAASVPRVLVTTVLWIQDHTRYTAIALGCIVSSTFSCKMMGVARASSNMLLRHAAIEVLIITRADEHQVQRSAGVDQSVRHPMTAHPLGPDKSTMASADDKRNARDGNAMRCATAIPCTPSTPWHHRFLFSHRLQRCVWCNSCIDYMHSRLPRPSTNPSLRPDQHRGHPCCCARQPRCYSHGIG